jgi:hypothetical protein
MPFVSIDTRTLGIGDALVSCQRGALGLYSKACGQNGRATRSK